MAAVILRYYKSTSLQTISLHGVGTPARAVNRRPAIRKRPESWCKLGSIVALNARNNLALIVAYHGRGVVWKYPGHWREVSNVAVDHAEQRGDGGLVGSDRIEVAHIGGAQANRSAPAGVNFT